MSTRSSLALSSKLKPAVSTEGTALLSNASLVDLLHLGGFVSGTLDLLERWEVVIVTQALVIVIDAQAKLDHSVDAASELRRLIQVEARGEQRSVEEQPDQVLHGLVRLVCGCAL